MRCDMGNNYILSPECVGEHHAASLWNVCAPSTPRGTFCQVPLRTRNMRRGLWWSELLPQQRANLPAQSLVHKLGCTGYVQPLGVYPDMQARCTAPSDLTAITLSVNYICGDVSYG